MNSIICDCGASISKKNINIHKKTKKHQQYVNGLLEQEQELLANEKIEEVQEEQDEQEEEEEEEEVHIEEKPKVKSKGQSAEHMEKIRVKAREAIRQKKLTKIQEKINKELELENKAKLYDEMLIKKQQEEAQKEYNKQLEINKKLKDYDKLMEENMKLKTIHNRNNLIADISNRSIAEEIKQERLKYLSSYLGINF